MLPVYPSSTGKRLRTTLEHGHIDASARTGENSTGSAGQNWRRSGMRQRTSTTISCSSLPSPANDEPLFITSSQRQKMDTEEVPFSRDDRFGESRVTAQSRKKPVPVRSRISSVSVSHGEAGDLCVDPRQLEPAYEECDGALRSSSPDLSLNHDGVPRKTSPLYLQGSKTSFGPFSASPDGRENVRKNTGSGASTSLQRVLVRNFRTSRDENVDRGRLSRRTPSMRRASGAFHSDTNIAGILGRAKADSDYDPLLDLLVSTPVLENTKLEETYRFALRVVLSRVGPTPDVGRIDTFHLLQHLRQMFKVPRALHMAWTNEENQTACKRSQLVVDVFAARGLPSMNSAGSCDSYVMLVMESPQDKSEGVSRLIKAVNSPDKNSLRVNGRERGGRSRSLSPSPFRRKPELSSAVSDDVLVADLPSQTYFQTTGVQTECLAPSWNERFDLPFESADDNTLSVFVIHKRKSEEQQQEETARRGSIFAIKETVKSLIRGTNDAVIGSVVLPLKEIPLAGLDKWLTITDVDNTSREKGEIHLGLHYDNPCILKECSRGGGRSEVEAVLTSMYYQQMLSGVEQIQTGVESDNSPARLPARPLSSLSAHGSPSTASLPSQFIDAKNRLNRETATQSNTTPGQSRSQTPTSGFSAPPLIGTALSFQNDHIVQQMKLQVAMTDATMETLKWLSFFSLIKNDLLPVTKEVCIGVMISMKTLRNNVGGLKDLEHGLLRELMDSFHLMLSMLAKTARFSGHFFPPLDANVNMVELLRVVKSVYTNPIFVEYHHGDENFGQQDLEKTVQRAVEDFYAKFGLSSDSAVSSDPWCSAVDSPRAKDVRSTGIPYNRDHLQNGPLEFIKARCQVLQELVDMFDNTQTEYAYYQTLFKRVNVDYTALVTTVLSQKFTEEMQVLVLVSLKHFRMDAEESCESRLALVKVLLKLFTTAKKMMCLAKQTPGVKENVVPLYETFQPVLPLVLESWRSESLKQVSRAIVIDPMIHTLDKQLCSASALDVCIVFNTVLKEWKLLSDWPDESICYSAMICIVNMICDGALSYAVLAHQRIKERRAPRLFRRFTIASLEESAILQNNINHVQETLVLKLPDWFAEHIKPTTMRRRSGHSRVEVDDIATRYSPEDGNVDVMRGLAESSLATVRRLVRSTELHMDDCIRTAFNVVSNTMVQQFHDMLSAGNVADAFTFTLNTFSKVSKLASLQVSLRKRIILHDWNRILHVTQKVVNGRMRPMEFYNLCEKHLKVSVPSLVVKTLIVSKADLQSESYTLLEELIEMHSLADSDLFRMYFKSLAEQKSPSGAWGSVTVQVGKTPHDEKDMTNIHVNLLHYRGVYATEDDIENYYVYFQCQLLPVDVVGNEDVHKSQFCQGTTNFVDVEMTLPVSQALASSPGSVLRISAFHKKRRADELLGEVVLSLKNIGEMTTKQVHASPQQKHYLQLFFHDERNLVLESLKKRAETSSLARKFVYSQTQWLKAGACLKGQSSSGVLTNE